MSPNEAHLAIHKHLAQAIQYLAGQEDEQAGNDFATLILTDHLDILVTETNDDGSFTATVKLIELPNNKVEEDNKEASNK